jgi:hypothetical protein
MQGPSHVGRAELLKVAAISGAIERFTETMAGPPEFDGCDEDDICALIREFAPWLACACLGQVHESG